MQKLYLQIPEPLHVRMTEYCGDSGTPIFRLFEDAIAHASERGTRFWHTSVAYLPKRRNGRRAVDDTWISVGTQISTGHAEQLKDLCAEPKRFKSDVLTAVLYYYLNRPGPSRITAAAAMELLLYPSFRAEAVLLPKDVGRPALRPDAIPRGSTVLIDAWVLLCGASTIVRDSACSYLSEQCWRLLQRCRTRELTGIISTLDIVAFQRLLSNFWHRANNSSTAPTPDEELAKKKEIVRRMYAITQCGLQVMPLGPQHIRAGVSELIEEKSTAAISIACAQSFSQDFVVATLGSNYDGWINRFLVFKASDAGISPPLPANKASDPNKKPYVKLSIEAEYARIMADLGRAIPPTSQRIIDKAKEDAKKNAENRPEVKPLEVKPAHLPMFLWASQRRKKRVRRDKASEKRSARPEQSAIPVPVEVYAF